MSAKRTAIAHTIFNVAGVIFILILFYPFLNLVGKITQLFGYDSPLGISLQSTAGSRESILVALSLYHTIFNVLNTLLLVWFVPLIVKSVKYIIPYKENDEEFSLKYINTGLMSTGEIALVQARKEIAVYIERVIKMFGFVRDLYNIKSNSKFEKLLLKIRRCEDISDRMELEIASYLTKISEENVSAEGSENISSMLNLISNIESMADSINMLAGTLQRKADSKIQFNKDIEKNILKLYSFIEELLNAFRNNMTDREHEYKPENFRKMKKLLLETEQSLKQEHFRNLHKGKYKTSVGVIYSDIYTYIVNIGRQTFDVIDLFFQGGRGMTGFSV